MKWALLLLVACSNASSATTIPTKFIGRDVHGLAVKMPLVGAGTWEYNSTVAYESLCKAFALGYTFVDTAFGYGNQAGVGKAIRDCAGTRRQDLFIMTKVPGGLSRSDTIAAHHQNLWLLGQEYVDHLMLHYPADWQQHNASKEMRQQQWIALEEIWRSGKARSIGVSHNCKQHLQDIWEIATVPISINQVEYHVGSGDVNGVRAACAARNVTFMSFSPLCGPCALKRPSDSLVSGDLVTSIARKYPGVTGSQVALRFIVQQAVNGTEMGGVIPKSNNVDHMRCNMNIFNFELSADDMQKLQSAVEPAAESGDCNVP
jgi:diketogulonate reductase-like aldo/keto reductase